MFLNIYNLEFKYIGGLGRVRRVCDCYDPNPTRPTIKKIYIIQPNLPTLKNRPNSAGWVR